MRYIDTGSRNATHALLAWLERQLETTISELRWQSGYFTAEPLGLFASTFHGLAQSNGIVRVLIGSNPPGSRRDDVLELARLLGLPRSNAQLGVIQYGNALYHPKTYHIRRTDGTQAAYVGSANLSGRGTSMHVEAGLTLDTRDGDTDSVLNSIASAVDAWFTENHQGLRVVADIDRVDQLVSEGILIVNRPPPPPGPPAVVNPESIETTQRQTAPRLASLGNLPPLPSSTSSATPAPSPPALPSGNRNGFPSEIVFDLAATGPTVGAAALSGTPLPLGAVGLIIRLTRDDTRVFGTGIGTANINLPVNTMPTLRFGILGSRGRGNYSNRPRAEYDLSVRYIGRTQSLILDEPAETNVMGVTAIPQVLKH
jgi:hypothetical protein